MDSSAAPNSQDTGTQQVGSDSLTTTNQSSVDLSNYITKEHAGRITSDKYGEGRRKGFEEGRKAALETQQQSNTAQATDNLSQPQKSPPTFSEEEIDKRIEAKLQQKIKDYQQDQQSQNQRYEVEKIITDLDNRIGAAAKEHPNIREAFESLASGAIPAAQATMVQALISVDNTADLIMAWSENPMRMHEIISMANTSPVLAQRQLQTYATSLKANKDAKKSYQKVNAPLSKIEASNTGMDSGEQTINDFSSRPEYKR